MQFTRKIVLSLLFIVLCSAMAFASEESPVPEQAPLEVPSEYYVDQELAVYRSMASSLAAANPQYTIDDIYSLLLTTNSTLSTISTRTNTVASRVNLTNEKLDTLLYGLLGTNTGTPALDIISTLYLMDGSGNQYTLSELVGMCWARLGNIDSDLDTLYTLSNQASSLISESQRTNAKLEYVFSAIEDTINIKWYETDFDYLGTSLSYGGSYLTQVTSVSYQDSLFFTFVSSTNSNPQLYRFTLPFRRNPPNFNGSFRFSLVSLKAFNNSDPNTVLNVDIPEHFFMQSSEGTFLYLFNFPARSSYTYTFEVTLDFAGMTFDPNFSSDVFSIPFDTLDYHIIRTAFNESKSAKSLDQLDTVVSTLSQIAPSQAYIQAEQASQGVINETLNDFTGSGSGAVKSSDSRSMKDVSSSLQSGLDSGGSVSGATGVFNSGSDFWGWFSQQNSNYINNPYPAPVVSPTRGSGDEIVDFLTPNSNELQYLLRQGGDQR